MTQYIIKTIGRKPPDERRSRLSLAMLVCGLALRTVFAADSLDTGTLSNSNALEQIISQAQPGQVVNHR